MPEATCRLSNVSGHSPQTGAGARDEEEGVDEDVNTPANLVEIVRSVGKLVLKGAQNQRGLAASTWTTLLSPGQAPEIAAAQKAGSDYNNQVQNKMHGHNLGSPHTHKAIALVEQQAKDLAEGNGKKSWKSSRNR